MDESESIESAEKEQDSGMYRGYLVIYKKETFEDPSGLEI